MNVRKKTRDSQMMTIVNSSTIIISIANKVILENHGFKYIMEQMQSIGLQFDLNLILTLV